MVVQRILDEVNLKLHELRINRHLRRLEKLEGYARKAPQGFEPNPTSIRKAIKEAEYKKKEMAELKEGWKNPWYCEVPQQRINRFLVKVEAAQKKNDELLAALKRHQK